MRLFLIFFCLSIGSYCSRPARDTANPIVVLPPFLRTGTTNTIIITPIKQSNTDNVDIFISVNGISGSNKLPIFSQKFKAKRAGSTHSVNFNLNSNAEKAEVLVHVQNQIVFQTLIRIRPDVGVIHLYTSKSIYRAGETVEVRTLPLNEAGNIFTGPLDVALVNPDGYELTRHRVAASDGFVSLKFELPLHLFFGDWRILARPAGFRDTDLTYETLFTVRDYELPPFQAKIIVDDDSPLERTSITVQANYFYGAPVDGTLIFYCSPHAKNETSTTHRLLQVEVC